MCLAAGVETENQDSKAPKMSNARHNMFLYDIEEHQR